MISLLGVAWVFHTGEHLTLLLPLLVGFIVSFALSQGAVIWVYLGEVFPTNVRSKGQSLGVFFPLDRQRHHRQHLPVRGRLFQGVALRVLRRDDGRAVHSLSCSSTPRQKARPSSTCRRTSGCIEALRILFFLLLLLVRTISGIHRNERPL